MRASLGTFSIVATALLLSTAVSPSYGAGQERAARQQSLSQIASSLTRESGLSVLVDNALVSTMGNIPRVKATPESLETLLDELIRPLPQGTIWVKAMLPSGPRAQVYRADDVVDYLLAQSRLFGKVGFSVPGGIELMGQSLLQDKAQPLVSTLNLKPVYVIVNPAQHGNSTTASTAILPPDFVSKNSDKISKMSHQERVSAFETVFRAAGMIYRESYNKLGIEDRISLNRLTPSLLDIFMNGVNGR